MGLCYLKPHLVFFTPSKCWHPNGMPMLRICADWIAFVLSAF